MSVRIAGATDTDAAIRLVSALLLELGGQPLIGERAVDAYRTLISGELGSGFVMLAGPSAAPHAVCAVSFVHAIRTLGRYGIIQEMYVEPEFRSTGIGRQLLEAALAEAVARGCSIVELGTPHGGERQIQFYERSGFTSVGERLRWRPPSP